MPSSTQVLRFLFCLVVTLLFSVPSVAAAPKYLFKIGSLAPEGSVWTKRFREFAGEIEEKSNGQVGFKVYAGGVMGDDLAMYRKMRVGQLHGGGFTMTGIGAIVPDFRVMGIPFLFSSYEEVDHVKKGLSESFAASFAENGMEFIAMTEVGFIYTMSTEPVSSVDDLRKSKCWTPDNDPLSSSFLETLGVSPTALSIPDVLTSLQTGLVSTVFNSLYGSIVLQWFTKAKYITDMPFGYAYGVFLLDRKAFSRLPPEYKHLVKTTADKYFGVLLEETRKSNEEAWGVLAENGVTMVKAAPDSLTELQGIRDRTVVRVKGTAFSAKIYDETMSLLEQFRGREQH